MAVKNERTFESKCGSFTVGNHRIVSCKTKRCDVAAGWNETVYAAAIAGESEDPSKMWHRILNAMVDSRLYNWEEL